MDAFSSSETTEHFQIPLVQFQLLFIVVAEA